MLAGTGRRFVLKKIGILLIGVIIMFGLFGCGKKKENLQADVTAEKIEISVLNRVAEADIWVIPDTESNRKSSLWGTATLQKLKTDDRQAGSAIKADNDSYLIRMIDADEMYYSVDGITLKTGDCIVINPGEDIMSALIEVYDESGALNATYEMFVARL